VRPTIGTALESADGAAGGEQLVNCLVRWDDTSQRIVVAALAAALGVERMERAAAERRAAGLLAAAGASAARTTSRVVVGDHGGAPLPWGGGESSHVGRDGDTQTGYERHSPGRARSLRVGCPRGARPSTPGTPRGPL
jgi:hypothetical protein